MGNRPWEVLCHKDRMRKTCSGLRISAEKIPRYIQLVQQDGCIGLHPRVGYPASTLDQTYDREKML